MIGRFGNVQETGEGGEGDDDSGSSTGGRGNTDDVWNSTCSKMGEGKVCRFSGFVERRCDDSEASLDS